MGHRVSIMVISSTTSFYIMAASATIVAAGVSPHQVGKGMATTSFPHTEAKKPFLEKVLENGIDARDCSRGHSAAMAVTKLTPTCSRGKSVKGTVKSQGWVLSEFSRDSCTCGFVGPSSSMLSSYPPAASRKRCRSDIAEPYGKPPVLYMKRGGSRRDRRRSNWNLYRSRKCQAVENGSGGVHRKVNSSTALQAVSIPIAPPSSTSSALLRYNANARRKKRREKLLKKIRQRPLFQEDSFTKNLDLNGQSPSALGDNHQVTGFATLPVEPMANKVENGNRKVTSLLEPKQCKNKTEKSTEMDEITLVKIPKPSVSLRKQSKAEGFAAADVSTLRKIFGTNKNKFWGDLDFSTARILYHTLLPRALIRLHAQGLTPDELAPLAYEARVAAKKYARERSQVPGRILAVAYDGFRHLRQYGKWNPMGLTWDELWNKYEKQIQEEIQIWDPSLKLEDLTSQVCLKILESSCRTNDMIDRLVIGTPRLDEDSHGEGDDSKQRSDAANEILVIANKFDQDVQDLLNQMEEGEETIHRTFLLRLLVAARRRMRNIGGKTRDIKERGEGKQRVKSC